MRHILIFLLCFVLAGFLLAAIQEALLDRSDHRGTASPIAFPHQSIRMDSEEVTIRLHKKSYTVTLFSVFQHWRDVHGAGSVSQNALWGSDFFPSAVFHSVCNC